MSVEDLPQSITDLEAAGLAGLLGAEVTSRDFGRLDSAPVVYRPLDRPLAGGHLPVVSAAGDRSHLARIGDPKDALGSTFGEAMHRLRCERRAEVLAAATEVLRTRKTTHSAPIDKGRGRSQVIEAKYPTMLREAFQDDDA